MPLINLKKKRREKNKNKVKIKISQKELNYILIGLSIIIAAFYFLKIYYPMSKDIQKEKMNLLQMRNQYISQLQKIKQKNKLEAELKIWKENKHLLDNFDLEPMSVERSLYIVEEYLQSNSIRIDKMKIRNDLEQVIPQYIVYDAQISGEYVKIRKFFEEIENLLHIVRFENIKMWYEEGETKATFSILFDRT